MVKSYCVKQKKQTECVPGSERYVKAKNGRTMMKCTCAECRITKTKFVKSQSTGGVIIGSPTKPYCGINKVPKGKHLGTEMECIRQNQIRQYGINKADKSLINNVETYRKNMKIKPKTAKSIKRSEELLKNWRTNKTTGKLIEPSLAGGSLFDIHDSHSLSEIALKGLANSGAYLARKGVAKAIKSDYAKKKIKNVANKYLDQVLDSFASNLSKKILPTGGDIDIHKAILKVAPKKGFVMPGHRYTGPGNPLKQQLRYDPRLSQSPFPLD